MAAIVKWGSHAFSTEFLLTVRFGAGLLAFLALILFHRRPLPYRTAYLGRCCLIAVSWLGAIFCCYLSLRFIPLTDAVLLLNTGPLWAPLMNRIFLKKTEPASVWLGIALGFAGVVVVLQPGANILQFPALVGLMAGLFLAVRLVVNSSIAGKESKDVISFYSLAVGWLVCLVILALTGMHVANWEPHLFPPRDCFHPWIVFSGVILAVTALGILSMLQPWFTTAAYEYASVGEAGPFRYFGVIFAGFLDWLFWGQIPDLHSVLGFLLIAAGGVWVLTLEGKK